ARSHNTNHAAVPAIAVKDHAESSGEVRRSRQLLFDFFHDTGFFALPLGVQPVEFFRNLPAACRIFAGKQLDDVTGHVHSTGGVDARPQAKTDVTRVEFAAGFCKP